MRDIPKTSYVSFSQLQLGVFDTVANFNVGHKASILIYECMNIIIDKYTFLGCHKINKARLRASKYGSSERTNNRQKIRHGQAKQKDGEEKHMKL